MLVSQLETTIKSIYYNCINILVSIHLYKIHTILLDACVYLQQKTIQTEFLFSNTVGLYTMYIFHNGKVVL